MIENVAEKIKSKQLDFEHAESGNVVIIERRFDQATGVPVMRPTQETSTSHIQDLIDDHEEKVMGPGEQRRRDLTDLYAAVEAKEKERAKLEKGSKK